MATYMVANHSSPQVRPASQLSVGRVKRVGPYKQEHAGDIDPHVIEVKCYACANAEKYRCYGYGVGGDSEFFCEACPCISYWPVKSQIDMFLGVHRLQGVAVVGRGRFIVVVHRAVYLRSLMVLSMHFAM